ncbi:MAG: hemerythrin domain-containing protein [Dehalococcoidia bacterium]
MNAIDMLKQDHQKVLDLYRRYEQGGGSTGEAQTARTILMELEIHSKLEEEIFYPAVRAAADGGHLQEVVAEGYEEHHAVDQLIEELKAMPPGSDDYDRKFSKLMQDVQHHIREEESEMLPDAQRRLGDRAQQLGDQMMQRKQHLMQQAQM